MCDDILDLSLITIVVEKLNTAPAEASFCAAQTVTLVLVPYKVILYRT